MLSVSVTFPAKAMAAVASELAAASEALGAYAAEAGLPGGVEGAESTPPAEYMYYQDRGFWAGRTYVEASPWFSGTLEEKRKRWIATVQEGAEAVLSGSAKPQALALKVASEMRNDFVSAITRWDLIDTGDARRSVAFRVVERDRGEAWQR